jgi:hypothetical protein
MLQRTLGHVLGQITASLQLGDDQEETHEVAQLVALHGVLLYLIPDEQLHLSSEVINRLVLFVLFAVPGYALAVMTMDRIGHRRLQFIGFGVMAMAFLTLAAFAHLTTMIVPFLAIF